VRLCLVLAVIQAEIDTAQEANAKDQERRQGGLIVQNSAMAEMFIRVRDTVLNASAANEEHGLTFGRIKEKTRIPAFIRTTTQGFNRRAYPINGNNDRSEFKVS